MSHGYWSVLATRWLQIILVDRASVGKRRAEAKYFVKVDLHWFLNSIDLLSWTHWRENGNHIPEKFFAWNCTHRLASKFTIGSDKPARQNQRIAFTCLPDMIRLINFLIPRQAKSKPLCGLSELQPIYTTVSTRFTDQYNISDQTKHHRGAGSRNLAVMVNAAMSWCMPPKYLASIHWRYDSSFQTMHCAFSDSQMPKQLSCLLGALNRHPNGLCLSQVLQHDLSNQELHDGSTPSRCYHGLRYRGRTPGSAHNKAWSQESDGLSGTYPDGPHLYASCSGSSL